jgi:phosphoglycerate dehydrogenase-like enzyme
MGASSSSDAEPTGFVFPVRVLFLGDTSEKDTAHSCAYEYTKHELSIICPDVTVVQATPETVAMEINRADVIVPLLSPITKGVIARAANLKLICQFGHDVSAIDLVAASAANIPVTRIPSKDAGIAESATEYALGLALGLLRNMSPVPPSDTPLGKNLCGMKALVFGDGGIGERLSMCLQALGMEVLIADSTNPDSVNLLPLADIVFFCCRPTERTKRFIDIEFLSKTKDGVYIINISRVRCIHSLTF